MNINPAAFDSSTNPTSTTDPSKETNDMFLKLLMAQLQGQSPLNPVDPTQFVGQLVQFNTLDQLIQIRQILQQGLQPATSSSTIQNPTSK